MNMHCPVCRAAIPLEDVNVANDIALCRRCGKNYSYAEVSAAPETPINLALPPKGCWVKQEARDFEVGASTRHPAVIFLILFMLLWSGVSMGGIYGKQITRGQFDLGDSLFGLPFLLGTIGIGWMVLIMTFGRVTVSVRGDDGIVFSGVGPIGRRKRFRWSEVRDMRLTRFGESNGKAQYRITLDVEKPIHFGTMLKEERQQFLLAALRQMRGR